MTLVFKRKVRSAAKSDIVVVVFFQLSELIFDKLPKDATWDVLLNINNAGAHILGGGGVIGQLSMRMRYWSNVTNTQLHIEQLVWHMALHWAANVTGRANKIVNRQQRSSFAAHWTTFNFLTIGRNHPELACLAQRFFSWGKNSKRGWITTPFFVLFSQCDVFFLLSSIVFSRPKQYSIVSF